VQCPLQSLEQRQFESFMGHVVCGRGDLEAQGAADGRRREDTKVLRLGLEHSWSFLFETAAFWGLFEGLASNRLLFVLNIVVNNRWYFRCRQDFTILDLSVMWPGGRWDGSC